MTKESKSELSHQMPSWREVFLYFLFLGFVNVGGPVAQITMMCFSRHRTLQDRRCLRRSRRDGCGNRLYDRASLDVKHLR